MYINCIYTYIGTLLGWSRSQKTPEMNELETNNIFLKIWAHNFEKQKSYSIWKIEKQMVFFLASQ